MNKIACADYLLTTYVYFIAGYSTNELYNSEIFIFITLKLRVNIGLISFCNTTKWILRTRNTTPFRGFVFNCHFFVFSIIKSNVPLSKWFNNVFLAYLRPHLMLCKRIWYSTCFILLQNEWSQSMWSQQSMEQARTKNGTAAISRTSYME